MLLNSTSWAGRVKNRVGGLRQSLKSVRHAATRTHIRRNFIVWIVTPLRVHSAYSKRSVWKLSAPVASNREVQRGANSGCARDLERRAKHSLGKNSGEAVFSSGL